MWWGGLFLAPCIYTSELVGRQGAGPAAEGLVSGMCEMEGAGEEGSPDRVWREGTGMRLPNANEVFTTSAGRTVQRTQNSS